MAGLGRARQGKDIMNASKSLSKLKTRLRSAQKGLRETKSDEVANKCKGRIEAYSFAIMLVERFTKE